MEPLKAEMTEFEREVIASRTRRATLPKKVRHMLVDLSVYFMNCLLQLPKETLTQSKQDWNQFLAEEEKLEDVVETPIYMLVEVQPNDDAWKFLLDEQAWKSDKNPAAAASQGQKSEQARQKSEKFVLFVNKRTLLVSHFCSHSVFAEGV